LPKAKRTTALTVGLIINNLGGALSFYKT
jgi:hypothetical protein